MDSNTQAVSRQLPGLVLRIIVLWILLSITVALLGSAGSVELMLLLIVAVIGATLWTFVPRR